MIRSLTVAFVTLTAPVQMQQQLMCGNYDDVVAAITSPKYGEVPVSEGTIGLEENGAITQTFANPVTRTWSQIMVPKPGIACMMTGGINFGHPKIPAKQAPTL